MSAPATLHLVRHATHGLLPHTLAGRTPVPLDEGGRQQAARLATHFAGQDIAAVVASPVRRAMETAAPIAARLGLAVHAEPGFEEIDFGTWSGRRFDSLDDDPAWHRWNRPRSLAACPGGETMLQAQARAMDAVRRLHAAWPGAAVLAVSHADILKAIVAAALGLSLDHLQRLTIDPASITRLTVSEAELRVEAINVPA